MHQFDVNVCRVGYGHRDIRVLAPDAVAAAAEALDRAGNESYSEHDSEYSVQGVTNVATGRPEAFETAPAVSASTEMRCPRCGSAVRPAGSVFVEEGHFDGNSYEKEGNADKYRCTSTSCGWSFVDWNTEDRDTFIVTLKSGKTVEVEAFEEESVPGVLLETASFGVDQIVSVALKP